MLHPIFIPASSYMIVFSLLAHYLLMHDCVLLTCSLPTHTWFCSPSLLTAYSYMVMLSMYIMVLPIHAFAPDHAWPVWLSTSLWPALPLSMHDLSFPLSMHDLPCLLYMYDLFALCPCITCYAFEWPDMPSVHVWFAFLCFALLCPLSRSCVIYFWPLPMHNPFWSLSMHNLRSPLSVHDLLCLLYMYDPHVSMHN